MNSIINILNNPVAFSILAAWTLPWKGVALWRAARVRDKWWFIAILILNTVGILPILYIFIWNKRASLAFKSENK